jgi:PhnB protein
MEVVMDSAIELNIYLHFDRTCHEAMKLYQSVFGGELTVQTRGEVDPKAPDDMKDLLIHANLEGGLVKLMGSDSTGIGNKPQRRIEVSLNGTDEAKMRQIYDELAAGGTADQPLKKEFWGDIFGGLTDKYGIRWLINIAAKP